MIICVLGLLLVVYGMNFFCCPCNILYQTDLKLDDKYSMVQMIELKYPINSFCTFIVYIYRLPFLSNFRLNFCWYFLVALIVNA